MIEDQPLRLVFLMPLRDDWRSAAELIRRIDRTVGSATSDIRVLLVDDGSIQKCPVSDFQGPFSAVKSIEILRLRRNLGHQRAIAIGLAHLQENHTGDAVLVMDSDGEDTPEGVLQLLETFAANGGNKVIFAQRARRSETVVFRAFYHVYRHLHHGLTGISVRVGNFSLLPWEDLNTLVAMSELWNHYAAAIFRSRVPFSMVPIARGSRIAGSSHMNFTALVSHGLSSMSVFADVVGVRVLISSLVGSLFCAIGVIAVAAFRIFSNHAIPGWATYAASALVIIMIQFITIATSFTFFMLSNRTNLGFVPFRDYSLFTKEAVYLFP